MTRRPPIIKGEIYKRNVNPTCNYYALIVDVKINSWIVSLGIKKYNDGLILEGLYNRWWCPMESFYGKASFGRYMGKGYTKATPEEEEMIKKFVMEYFEKAMKIDVERRVE